MGEDLKSTVSQDKAKHGLLYSMQVMVQTTHNKQS